MTDADGNIDLSQIYAFAARGGGAAGPSKFNVLTGLRSPICPDPLCDDHSPLSDCVFGGVSMMTAAGEWLYFAAFRNNLLEAEDIEKITYTSSVRAYNYLTREFRVLYSVSDDVFNNVAFQRFLQYRDGYLYFSRRAYDADTDDYTLWSLLRVNADTGRVEVIVNATQGMYVEGIGDELVFEDMLSVRGSTVIYKTDMSYQNRVDLVKLQGTALVNRHLTYENYIYFSHYITGEDGRRKEVLSRFDIHTGETSKVAEFPSSHIGPFLIGDWIYYVLEHDRSEGRVYRVSAAGGEPEIFYENSEYSFLWADGIGQYVVITFRTESEYGNDTIVIDTETGEIVVY
jgi:hypothetical protein